MKVEIKTDRVQTGVRKVSVTQYVDAPVFEEKPVEYVVRLTPKQFAAIRLVAGWGGMMAEVAEKLYRESVKPSVALDRHRLGRALASIWYDINHAMDAPVAAKVLSE